MAAREDFIEVTIPVSRTFVAALESLMQAQGALAVTFRDVADVPVLEPPIGETPLWPEVMVSGLFPGQTPVKALQAALSLAPGVESPGQVAVSGFEDRDWMNAWKADAKPLRFGQSLWIVPTHCEPPEPAALNLRLDPGLAFGSGTHPSTRLCLEWIDRHDLRGMSVVDYGCGSGVLAVAAAMKGAAKVTCVDIDPQALLATRENAAANSVGHLVDPLPPDSYAVKGADVMLANILSGTLIELAPVLGESVRRGGWLVLAGVLNHQAEAVIRAFGRRFSDWDQISHEEWAGLSARAV